MNSKRNPKPFTGRHMLFILVGGFGIVAAVNFYMASLAVGGFHGIVVENSYVASQKFNGWLEEAEKDRALGWAATAERDAMGRVLVRTSGVPEDAAVSAALRRPLGQHEFAQLNFVAVEPGLFRSTTPVSEGRWTMRMTIAAQGQSWVEESELP